MPPHAHAPDAPATGPHVRLFPIWVVVVAVSLMGGLAWWVGWPGLLVALPPREIDSPVRLVVACLLTAAAAGLFALLLGWVRRWAITRAAPSPPGTAPAATTIYRDLMALECLGIVAERRGITLDPRNPEAAAVAVAVPVLTTREQSPADEPFVTFQTADLTGLALSGGGIRSATFNLGLLQGLDRAGILGGVDYLSTVSGGGYIGGFWSAWLMRQRQAPAAIGTPGEAPLFPGNTDANPAPVESHEVRHLREFGRFLAPRVGLLEVETWTALVAASSGLLPALAIALAFIGLGLITWLLLTIPLASSHVGPAVAVVVAVTAAALAGFEYLWQKVKLQLQDPSAARARARRLELWQYVGICALVLLVIGLLQANLPAARTWSRTPPAHSDGCAPVPASARQVRYVDPCWREIHPGATAWWDLTGLDDHRSTARTLSPGLFDYSLVWLAMSIVLFTIRLVHPLVPVGDDTQWLPAFDRVLMRVLGLAVFWMAIAALWHLALNLDWLWLTAVSASLSAGAFALLRNWIGVALQKPRQPGVTGRAKAWLPQALAYLTIVLAVAAMGQFLIVVCAARWEWWWGAASAMLSLLVVGLFIDPAKFGLHAFYRDRISRAYAGASNLPSHARAADNRLTDPQPGDDPRLDTMPCRPLHLVCCAANDLNGDHVGTLARGARSAVLSRYGFAVGPHCAPAPDVTLGAAVTASAAAFNSNMGDVSMALGPGVSFLMTALNLRLGLWLRHPAAKRPRPRRWPGLLLYRELFGLTSASDQLQADKTPLPFMRDVHLSDGGHFENLGLYELVRRHCRYILVSDCGADPTIAFDDLGRALRRVRQDFGVDIAIDVDALKPDSAGLSRQHVAIGRIRYSASDVGILVYVKPTITGDEPADVMQYRTRNGAFPHEGTGDQFYDEAQWESYRRLGMHVAERVFDFVQSGEPTTADALFANAAHRWGATPPDLEQRVLEMTRRMTELELDLQSSSARALLYEVFPELSHWTADGPVATAPAADRAATPADRDASQELVLLLRLTQVLEDIWMACDLDTWWAHPLNLGWVNLFARWVTTPTFRFWWPLLGPMYSQGFREFLEARFLLRSAIGGTGLADTVPWRGQVSKMDAPPEPSTLAAYWWETRAFQPCPWRPDARADAHRAATPPPTYYEDRLELVRRDGTPARIQVGLVAVQPFEAHVGWTSDDFFVPPSLWGAGIGWHFLKRLLVTLARDFRRAYVIVRVPAGDGSRHITREDARAFIDQYRKIGFSQRPPDAPRAGLAPAALELVTRLDYVEGRDTLLELDLPSWAADPRRVSE